MAVELKPERAIVPIIRYAPDRPISELLGTGFFVGDGESLHLITAKHVFGSSPLVEGEKYALVFNDGKGIAIFAISQSALRSILMLPSAVFQDHTLSLRFRWQSRDPILL